jgi:23S rRNA (adenine2030-N6)-methyltransferase
MDFPLLSYRHAFHAGNFADLLKHIILVDILAYMTQKDKPFDYIDTHAGAGMYPFDSIYASKNKEYLNGIGHWFTQGNEQWPELADYLQRVKSHNPNETISHYPGSPTFAVDFLRRKDRAWLFEMHPSDHELLQKRFERNRQVSVQKEDGYHGLLALLPCQSHRALVLMDPSYEIKQDFHQVIETAIKGHKKMPNTVFAIWYPVVKRARVEQMQNQLIESGIRNIQQFELGINADNHGFGMTSAGVIVINPPWTLFGKMQPLLPRLAKAVSADGELHFKCDVLVDE